MAMHVEAETRTSRFRGPDIFFGRAIQQPALGFGEARSRTRRGAASAAASRTLQPGALRGEYTVEMERN